MLKRILAIAAIILGASAVILWVMNLGPHGEPKPTVTDWISAVGQAVGAIGTAGALWLGAVTFRRQVRDQHRAQASAITVGSEVEARPLQEPKLLFFITNNSSQPIYRVGLHGVISEEHDGTAKADVLAPSKTIGFYAPVRERREVLAEFSDSAGTRWMRDETGQLIEWPEYNWWKSKKLAIHLWWITRGSPQWTQEQVRQLLAKARQGKQ